MLRIVYCIFRG